MTRTLIIILGAILVLTANVALVVFCWVVEWAREMQERQVKLG